MTINKPLDEQENKIGAYLVINNQIFPLNNEVTTIGRRLENDLVIQDFLVSRNHAEIRLEDGRYYVYDLDSTGGTFLNQKRITKGLLYSGDIILLTSVPVVFIDDTTTLKIPPEENTHDIS